MSQVTILDNLDASYVDAIVEVHKNALKGFFLTNLGDGFLKTYYRAMLKNKEALAVCIVDENNTVAGFGVGTMQSKGFHKRLILQNWFSFGLVFVKILFKSPSSIIRLAKNLEKKDPTKDHGNYPEFLLAGVSDKFQGQGMGKKLYLAYEERAKARGAQALTLTSDKEDNDVALNHFKKLGYSVLYEYIAYPNRPMYKFIKEL